MTHRTYTSFSSFKAFSNLICIFSTRQGGLSRGIYAQQNLGLKTGDDIKTVAENRKQFFKQFNISEKQIAFTDQIHSTNIVRVNKPGVYSQSDALITKETDIFLAIQTADCLPVFIFDPVNRVIAAIHAGWRGVKAGIITASINTLFSTFALRPQNFFVVIGPGLQKECFEVRSDVSMYFPIKYLGKHSDPGKKFLDLSGYVKYILLNLGIPEDQVEQHPDCTMCKTDLYYSYRRDKERSGRMIGLIGMRSIYHQ